MFGGTTKTLLELFDCLPAMLVCHPGFVGRSAHGLCICICISNCISFCISSVFVSEALLELFNCLPAMLVCDPTFVGRAAPELTPIRANSQISALRISYLYHCQKHAKAQLMLVLLTFSFLAKSKTRLP